MLLAMSRTSVGGYVSASAEVDRSLKLEPRRPAGRHGPWARDQHELIRAASLFLSFP